MRGRRRAFNRKPVDDSQIRPGARGLVIDALFLKIVPAFEKSSASTFGLIRIWSTTSTPAGNEFFSTFVSTDLAERAMADDSYQ